MVLILTARMAEWHMQSGPEVRISTLSLITSLSSPCSVLFVRVHMNECPGVALQTGSMLACVCCGDVACGKSARVLRRRLHAVTVGRAARAERFLYLLRHVERVTGKQKFSCTDTFGYTLLGRCRSMGKQDRGLCMPQSDSFKGHVSKCTQSSASDI